MINPAANFNSEANSKRILLIGPNGLLGQRIANIITNETQWTLITATHDTLTMGHQKESINQQNPKEFITRLSSENWRPDVIVNTAAYTNVDRCEIDRDLAWQTNVTLVKTLSQVAQNTSALLIQISTDYVFDGVDGPYTENAKPNPINYYGRSKLAAENICQSAQIEYLILRTMWLYGPHTSGRSSFVDWITNQLCTHQTANVVTDERGTPTFTDDIAYTIIRGIEKGITGIFNLAGPNLITRYEFAHIVAEIYGLDKSLINPVISTELNRIAKRPLESGLISLKAQTTFGVTPLSPETALNNIRIGSLV